MVKETYPSGTKLLDACTALRKTSYTNGFSLIGPLTRDSPSCAGPANFIESLPKT
jgi:hypothetical protein